MSLYFLVLLAVNTSSAWEVPQLPTRRDCLRTAWTWGLTTALTTAATSPAAARDEIFRKNPLTNPVLEQMRIWEQAEADELKYGGELERGDAKEKGDAYPPMLVPILAISRDLDQINQLVSLQTSGVEDWKKARQLLSKDAYEKVQFKRIFNRYGDNIYYSDPDRANVYLGGGATPKTEQSLAYLLRNEILTSIEDMTAELDYLIKTPDESPEDLQTLARTACDAMKRYLAIVPPRELEQAQRLFAEAS